MSGDSGAQTGGGTLLSFDSDLAAPQSLVWSEVTTFAGINAELAPWVKMTFPRALRDEGFDPSTRILDAAAADRTKADRTNTAGVAVERRVRSWLLIGGILPFDRHSFRLDDIIDSPDGQGFVEESTSWLQRRWRHERHVAAIDSNSCRVTDRLTVVPRLGLFARPAAFFVSLVFRHRHRRLTRRFGAGPHPST